MRIEIGVWYDLRNPPRWRQPWDRLYQESLEQAAWAEELGFGSVWLSEHHVTDDGYLPSLFPMLAALAVRTRTVRLGTAVMLAPFQHPLRLAEDAAFVDQLSGGRLDLGIAVGYREAEFEALGVPREERGSRTEELVAAGRAAWAGEPFRHRGRHWSFDDVVVTPPPFQSPLPLWIGGSSLAAARRAGRLGCHFLPNAFAPVEVFDAYRAALSSNGHDPDGFSIAVNPTIYVCPDPERGWAEIGEHLLYQENLYRRWGVTGAGAPELVERVDDLPRDRYLVGRPADVVAAIEALRERRGFDRLFTWARLPGLSLERSNASLELLAREVLPRFSE